MILSRSRLCLGVLLLRQRGIHDSTPIRHTSGCAIRSAPSLARRHLEGKVRGEITGSLGAAASTDLWRKIVRINDVIEQPSKGKIVDLKMCNSSASDSLQWVKGGRHDYVGIASAIPQISCRLAATPKSSESGQERSLTSSAAYSRFTW